MDFIETGFENVDLIRLAQDLERVFGNKVMKIKVREKVGISWPAECLLVSQKGPSSIYSVSSTTPLEIINELQGTYFLLRS
jgi:hypothetical protein